jgi:hypothetical protein
LYHQCPGFYVKKICSSSFVLQICKQLNVLP